MSKPIVYEGPERRTDDRLAVADGLLEIDGRGFALRNWSARGFVAAGLTGGLLVGGPVEARFILTLPIGRVEADAVLTFTRIEAREVAGIWTLSGYPENAYPQIRAFLYSGDLDD